MFLNLSTSINKTVGERPLNRAPSKAAATCSIIKPRFGRLVSESVCAESISCACKAAFARTARTTRNVTAVARTNIEIARTVRSTSFVGFVNANTTTGKTRDVVVSTSRPSSGCLSRRAECEAMVATLGCKIVAETKNKLAIYGALAN